MNRIQMSKFRMPYSFAIWYVALLAAAIFLVGCDSMPKEADANAAPDRSMVLAANQKGMKDALDVPLAGIDGKTLKIDDFKGKVVVLDFWATWCGPCRKQVPELVKLHERYRDQGLEVIGLTSEEKKTDQKKIEDFMKEFHVDYTVAYGNRWLSEAFLKGSEDETGQPPIPQLFVISRDGRVVDHLFAYDPPQNLEKVVRQELVAAR